MIAPDLIFILVRYLTIINLLLTCLVVFLNKFFGHSDGDTMTGVLYAGVIYSLIINSFFYYLIRYKKSKILAVLILTIILLFYVFILLFLGILPAR